MPLSPVHPLAPVPVEALTVAAGTAYAVWPRTRGNLVSYDAAARKAPGAVELTRQSSTHLRILGPSGGVKHA